MCSCGVKELPQLSMDRKKYMEKQRREKLLVKVRGQLRIIGWCWWWKTESFMVLDCWFGWYFTAISELCLVSSFFYFLIWLQRRERERERNIERITWLIPSTILKHSENHRFWLALHHRVLGYSYDWYFDFFK